MNITLLVKKMEQNQTLIIAAIIALVVGGAVGYTMAPTKTGETEYVDVEVNPLEGATIKIAEIASNTNQLETLTPFVEEIIEPDIQAYLDLLGYDVTYEILIDDAASNEAIHLEKVQSFQTMGVELIIGGRWSSQAEMALSYVNENDMLLFSPSSTSPLLAFPDDNLFRMCPTDFVQAPAVAEMLASWGIEHTLVIHRKDAWADGIYNIFKTAYPERGGTILGEIGYAAEVIEFSSYMQTADNIISEAIAEHGAEKVAILVICFEEGATMVTQASDYPSLMDVFWFGTDGTTFETRFLDAAPDVSVHIKLFSTLAAPGYSSKYAALSTRYRASTSRDMAFYEAADYDTNWAILNAVLEAGSQEALKVIPLIQTVTYNMYGASGWTKLNSDDDRDIISYDIWGIDYVAVDEPRFVKYGVFDGASLKVSWDTSLVTPGSVPPEWVP